MKNKASPIRMRTAYVVEYCLIQRYTPKYPADIIVRARQPRSIERRGFLGGIREKVALIFALSDITLKSNLPPPGIYVRRQSQYPQRIWPKKAMKYSTLIRTILNN